ncbi:MULTISPECIES: 4a-hydroxytetrahydrobiopterin dehydratase [Prochlorococcus]|uniref:Putative pterin-4 alpha-carbinolamine dehydratase-like protein n=1 Tax=Prochlorococcus marinus str. MIT 9116 TaxID=167544 RepID=A0A0A1ZPQ6_PROMR|nr:4a-hydroxytetrahydrobiopterin dehydratase [Prochlorococcus marinus]KGF90976.1 putative pterin-4 alpha-carbinolamine dehydratase-like protein [Prochlorococcus marinus str. MIT 9107]KGF91435.1 putative pterin-4 alpha-carbinolamine dehydratase-like protein [Prochlorococcus marinus str. MIT 9116]KGF93327.1 putative pterin-4 alpha-carbinolamine dehydratase-like protein [Prochlorococcus marinus str. MIT 9123]
MWNKRESPLRIEKRFEFEEYSKISKFMQKIESLCKEKDIYPNISFGKNFVSLSIFLDTEEISSREKDFSKDVDKFYLED